MRDIIGDEGYDALKDAMGENFDDFLQQYERGEIGKDDIIAKQKELGLLSNDVDDTSKDDGGVDDTKGKDDSTNGSIDSNNSNDDDGIEDKKDDKEKDVIENISDERVLEDGWLKEDGEVDYEKIKDESLREYIKGLNERLKKVEDEYNIRTVIMKTAMKYKMHDINDADRYIDINKLEFDDKGNIKGLDEEFKRLLKERPYLFKGNGSSGSNGFNPSKGNKTNAYIPGMDFKTAFKLTK